MSSNINYSLKSRDKVSEANPIEEVWGQLAGRQKQFVEAFYGNLFHQFPDYEKYFPEHMDAQMERMVELISSITHISNQINLIRPYLLQVGAAHKDLALLRYEDLCNFRDVFIATAAIVCAESWEERHALAFQAAFDDTIIPIVYEGLRR